MDIGILSSVGLLPMVPPRTLEYIRFVHTHAQCCLAHTYNYRKYTCSSLVKSESEVAQSCPALCNPGDCSIPGSSVHGIFKARVLEWVAISFSRGSSWPMDQTQVSCIAGRRFSIWATSETPKLGKEYVKAIYCHPACLIYMQSTSREMPGWMKHKLESRLLGEISITTDMHMTPPLWQKVKRN